MYGGMAGGPPSPGTPSGGSTSAFGQYAAKAGAMQGPVGVGNSAPLMLFMGTTRHKASKFSSANAAEHGVLTSGDRYMSVADASIKFAGESDEKIRHMALLLALAGYAGDDVTARQAVDLARNSSKNAALDMYQNFLKDAAGIASLRKVTPNQYLKSLLSYKLGPKWDGDLKGITLDNAGGLSLNGDSAGPKSLTTTSRSVNISDPATAKAAVRQLLQAELQRDPTQAEYEDFVATLHSAERSHPSVSTTTANYDAEGNQTSTNTVTRGGLTGDGANQIMLDRLKKNPKWGEWQAMGIYAPALFEALGAAVGGV